MLEASARRWMIRFGAAMLCALVLQSIIEYLVLSERPNDFEHPALGLPRLFEGPFDPTRAGIDPEKLPWIVDPADRWPPALQQAALRPCGLLTVLQARYPLWRPEGASPQPERACQGNPGAQDRDAALDRDGWRRSTEDGLGPVLQLDPAGDLVVERHPAWELAVEPRRGLVARRRSP